MERFLATLSALATTNQYLKYSLWKLFELQTICNANSSNEALLKQFSAGGEAGAAARAKFLQEARLDPPDFLRVIDCKLSVQQQAVVIIDFPKDLHCLQASRSSGNSTPIGGYTAISHTYGQPVYDIFNCICAADCQARRARARDPAKSPCKHEDPGLPKRVIGDVLGMCEVLVDGGVRYAWHDGVCIAQHNDEEVEHFIKHIAWIYANADDTVIFLHYIGRPMAPIAPPSYPEGLISRWQTRVWTFQEAALSKCRRYYLRMGERLNHCLNYGDFELKLASWYEPDGPNFTEILDEYEFFNLVLEMLTDLPADTEDGNSKQKRQVMQWRECLSTWLHLLWSLHCSFPTIAHALDGCSSRESKHEGDRINSILGLARVKDFYAHKDKAVEKNTMEFFKRMGKAGLAIALFTSNKLYASSKQPHTWYPTLCSELHLTPSHFGASGPNFHTDHLEFEARREDGSLEVRGLLACVSLHVTLFSHADEIREGTCIAGATSSSESLSAFANFMDYSLGVRAGGHGSQVFLAKDNLRSVLLGTAMRQSPCYINCIDEREVSELEAMGSEGLLTVLHSESPSYKDERLRKWFTAGKHSGLQVMVQEHLRNIEPDAESFSSNTKNEVLNSVESHLPAMIDHLSDAELTELLLDWGSQMLYSNDDPHTAVLLMAALQQQMITSDIHERMSRISSDAELRQLVQQDPELKNGFLGEVLEKLSAFHLIFPAEVFQLLASATDDDEDDFVVANDNLEDMQAAISLDKSLWRSSRSFAAVMVRGDIDLSSQQLAVVEKVGCFLASPMLLQVLHEHTDYLTFLDKLVIT